MHEAKQHFPSIWSRAPRPPLKISLLYLMFGLLWIFFSDRIAAGIATSQDQLRVFSSLKGWLFILVTTLLLYIVLLRNDRQTKQFIGRLTEAELRQRQAIKAGQIGLWDWDLNTNTVHYSAEWKRQIGYEDHEINDSLDEWRSRVHPEDLDSVEKQIQFFITGKQTPYKIEFRFRHKNGTWRWILAQAEILLNEEGKAYRVLGAHIDMTEQRKMQQNLLQFSWLIEKEEGTGKTSVPSEYDDITALNENGLILNTIGKPMLQNLAGNLMALLDTSMAIYEKNGDYAFGTFVSAWCGTLDNASRNLCKTNDNCKALSCGKWFCHDSCWATSKEAIDSGEAVDHPCTGGLHIYAVPILAGDEIIGAINFGYGTPPDNPEKLEELARIYQLPVEKLQRAKQAYSPRPPFIIDVAKQHLHSIARLIGETVERKQAESALNESRALLQAAMDNCQAGIAIADAPDGRLRYVNEAGLMIRGKAEKEIVKDIGIQKYVESWKILHLDGTPYKDDEVPLARAVLYGETCSADFIIRRDNNEDRVVWANAAPIKNEQDEVIAGIVVFLDITDQKKADQELKEYRDKLEEKVEERTHELRTIVNAMAGREVRMAELKEVIETLRSQLERAGIEPAADA